MGYLIIVGLEEELEDRLTEILSEDDVGKLMNFIFEQGFVPCFHGGLLNHCILKGAKNCTLHFLDLDYNSNVLLGAIAHLCDPQVIELLLKNCHGDHIVNQAIMGSFPHVNETIMGFLPLHLVLCDLMNMENLSNWSPGQSLIKLLILLCQPEGNGELGELAGLLLVAHERAMAPFNSGGTIKQHICLEDIVSQVIYGQCDAARARAAGLLDIFEKAGDALSTYYRSMQEDIPVEEVISQVADLIQKAGIQVLHKDVDLTDVYSFQPEVLRSIRKRLGIEMDGHLKDLQHSKKTMFPPLSSLWEGIKPYGPYPIIYEEPPKMSSSYQGIRPYSTASTIRKISTRKYPQARPSVRDMAYLTMKLKRGIRFL